MKITILSLKLDEGGGGSNVSLHAMARKLTARGHSIEIVTIDREQNKLPPERNYRVSEYAVDRSAHPVAWLREVKQIMTTHADCDLFHVFYPALLPAAGLYRRSGETPVVGRLNAYTLFCTNQAMMDGECHESCTTAAKFRHDDAPIGRKALKAPVYLSRTHLGPRLVEIVDKLFALSPAVESVYRAAGFDGEITVIPNFYYPRFDRVDREAPVPAAFGDGGFDVLYVGRLEAYKGVQMLLEATARLDPATSVHIVGDGPARSNLESYVESTQLRERVTFHGWVDHPALPRYYRAADVFVHPGTWPEPFGRTILESMRCGTPAIVSDVGGPPWIVANAGLTFESGNAEALRDQLEELAEDPTLLETLEGRCSDRVERFEPDRVLGSLEQEYDAVT